MPGYKHPCKYCGGIIEPDARVCPLCGKSNPLGPERCPKCLNPVEKTFKNCAHCGLCLEIICPKCGVPTFFGDYCGNCGAKLTVICPNPKCGTEQPPVSDRCVKCSKPLGKK